MPSRTPLAPLVLLALLTPACKKDPSSTTVDAGALAAPSAATATAPPAATGGWAYLVSSRQVASDAPSAAALPTTAYERKLVAIDPAGQVRQVALAKEIGRVLRGADGEAYVLTSGALGATGYSVDIWRLAGATPRLVATADSCSRAIASQSFDARGDRLVIRCKDELLEKAAGSDWKKVALPETGPRGRAFLSKTGALWYGSMHAVFERRGDAWTKMSGAAVGETFDFFDGPDGVYVTTLDGGLARARGSALEEVRPKVSRERILRASANGSFATSDLVDGTLRVDTLAAAGTAVATKASFLSETALDDGGRAWTVMDGQIEVVDAATGAVTTVPMGAYPELDALASEVVIVLGRGPAVPAAKSVRRTTKIKGTLVVDKKPLAGAQVELCPGPKRLFTGGSPCADVRAPHFQAVTGADGSFSVDDAPMGTYYLHYKPAGADKWSVSSWALGPLREGDVSEVGVVPRS